MIWHANYIVKIVILLVIGGMLIVLPFAVDNAMLFPTQNGRFFFLLIVGLAVAGLLSVFLLLTSNSPSWRLFWTDSLGILLSVYITIHIFITWQGSAPLRYQVWIALGLIYIAVRILNKNYFPYLLFTIMLAGVGQAIYGNLQLYGIYPSYHNLFRMTGSFFNPGPYAGYLVSVLPIGLGIYLFKDRLFKYTWQRVLFISIALLCIFTILLVLPASQSRAAWLGATASLIYLLALKYDVKKLFTTWFPNLRLRIITLVVLILLATVGGYGFYVFKKDSANGRILIWKITMGMMGEKPIFGHGPEKFSADYMEYQAAYFHENSQSKEAITADNVIYPFNEILRIATELGAVGLILTLGILILSLFGNSKQKKDQLWIRICRAGLLASITFGCFSYPLEILPIMANGIVYIAIVTGLMFTGESSDNLVKPSFRLNKKILKGIAVVIGIVILISFPIAYKQIVRQKEAYYTWKEAFELYQLQIYEASLSAYNEAFPHLQSNGDFLNHYGKALSMAGEHGKAIQILASAKKYLTNSITYTALGDSYKALEEYPLAEAAYLQAWYMIPHRFYPKYLLAKLYEETGQERKAIVLAKELLNKKVKIESTAIEQIKQEMNILLRK